jgi:hypothetical protein
MQARTHRLSRFVYRFNLPPRRPMGDPSQHERELFLRGSLLFAVDAILTEAAQQAHGVLHVHRHHPTEQRHVAGLFLVHIAPEDALKGFTERRRVSLQPQAVVDDGHCGESAVAVEHRGSPSRCWVEHRATRQENSCVECRRAFEEAAASPRLGGVLLIWVRVGIGLRDLRQRSVSRRSGHGAMPELIPIVLGNPHAVVQFILAQAACKVIGRCLDVAKAAVQRLRVDALRLRGRQGVAQRDG